VALAGAVATDRGKHRVPGRAQRLAHTRRRSVGSSRTGAWRRDHHATIILRPIAAGAALFFLVRGHLTWALVSMAVVILLGWITYLPSIQLHGLDLSGNLVEVTLGSAMVTAGLFFQLIIAPAVALAVAGLALTGKQMTLATLLAVLPTLMGVLGVVAFGISVAIYGF
jgi:hypothetical protein